MIRDAELTRWWLAAVSIFLIVVITPTYDLARARQCDRLQPLAGSEGYRRRGTGCSERCEGLYVSDVSSHLQVISLLQGELRFQPREDGVLSIRTSVPIQEPIYVRAMAIPLKTYYRMDAVLRPGCVLQWPTNEVLTSYARLRQDQLGVFGWIGTEENKTLVPLVVSTDGNPIGSSLTMIVRSTIEVEELGWRTRPNEKWQGPLTNLPVGAGESIRIELPQTSAKTFEVAIQVRTGSSWQELRVKIRRD